MNDVAAELWERIARLDPPRQRVDITRRVQQGAIAQAALLRAQLGPEPPTKWKNLAELDGAVDRLLQSGRARGAAELLARAYPPEARPWPVADRLATLRLHLGEPAVARAIWQGALDPPRPALRDARVALTYMAEYDLARARGGYRAAVEREPKLFEAWYGLAVLARDAGDAKAALDAARRAAAAAPTDFARRAAKDLAALVEPYVQ
jgi:tetratricopeptide (TPR) repeat protein